MDARPDDEPGADDATAVPDTSRPAEDDASAGPPPARDGASDAVPGDARPAEDDAWASIVARLQDVDAAGDAAPRERRVRRREPAPDVAPVPDEDEDVDRSPALVGRDWDGTAQIDAAEDEVDDREHFVPPDPGPVLGGDPLLTLAWIGAVGVPLFLLVVVVAWQDAPALLVRTAVGVFVVAVAVLVWRMPQRRDPADDDDGAVV